MLNHPVSAATTTRQRNAENLKGIPNLLVPRVLRFMNQPDDPSSIVSLIENDVGFPVIVRDPFHQMGKQASKLDTAGQLFEHLRSTPVLELYAIQYVHNPAANGIWRKIRAAVIGEDLIISHVHFGEQWNVHRERDDAKIQSVNQKKSIVSFADLILTILRMRWENRPCRLWRQSGKGHHWTFLELILMSCLTAKCFSLKLMRP